MVQHQLAEFIGARLRDARIARMMTGVSLAEAVGVTPAAITRFEKGLASPRPEVATKLSEALHVPVGFFYKPIPMSEPSSGLWMRSMASATKRARDSASIRVEWLREIASYVNDVSPLPPVNLPDLCSKTDPSPISEEEVEDYATGLRRAWGLRDGPIADLTSLIESNGVVVSCFSLNADKLEAFSKWTPEAPIAVENTDRCTAVRLRFDLAHELGHMVMHRHVPNSLAGRPEVHKLMESQAHRFAGAFLFPASPFVTEIYSVSVPGLIDAKRRWKLSAQVMIRRAFDLRLISRDQYERAFRHLSAQGYRRSEPLDTEMQPEEPSAIASRIRAMIQSHGFTGPEIVSHLRLRAREIETLSGLPTGYLESDRSTSGTTGKVVALRRR